MDLKLKSHVIRRMRLNKVHSNDGVYIKPIVALNSVYPLVLAHSKLPSYKGDDAAYHYLTLTFRPRTYRCKIIKQVEASVHRVVIKHSP